MMIGFTVITDTITESMLEFTATVNSVNQISDAGMAKLQRKSWYMVGKILVSVYDYNNANKFFTYIFTENDMVFYKIPKSSR